MNATASPIARPAVASIPAGTRYLINERLLLEVRRTEVVAGDRVYYAFDTGSKSDVIITEKSLIHFGFRPFDPKD